jgi:hypothetical protein
VFAAEMHVTWKLTDVRRRAMFALQLVTTTLFCIVKTVTFKSSVCTSKKTYFISDNVVVLGLHAM